MASGASSLDGLPFTKMSGSGNDFVVLDGRLVDAELVTRPEVIRAICNRHNGIGADGVVLLTPSPQPEALLLKYFNSDGSLGELCGNATLCSTALAVAGGLAPAEAVVLDTDAGRVHARLADGEPEIDLAAVREVDDTFAARVPLQPGERRVGYARAGVPHVVILVDDECALDAVDVLSRGRSIRQSAAMQPAGTNVNWVAPSSRGGWAYRTYERGVEGETLACGTGAVAAAILLARWGLSGPDVQLWTRSGRSVRVRQRSAPEAAPGEATWHPSLRGEGRAVFSGVVRSLPIAD